MKTLQYSQEIVASNILFSEKYNKTFFSFITGLISISNAMLMAPEIEESAVNISAILNQFMVGYDKRVRPNYGGIPVTVGVSLYILSIGDLSEKYMDFTFDMYFR